MNIIICEIKKSINRNKKEWIALLTHGYGIHYTGMWQLLGYQSKEEYLGELQESWLKLPTTSITHSS